jgi:uncharacterized protein (DUF2147 family)
MFKLKKLTSKLSGPIPVNCSLPLAAFVICLSTAGCQSEADHQTNSSNQKKDLIQKSAEVQPADYALLVGRWLRPDGGYVLEIQKVDINGKIQAAYYNPRTINVSQSLVAEKDGKFQIFIELRDVGYPGATYTLSYDETNDLLEGLYYQPAAGQTFEVQFVRQE